MQTTLNPDTPSSSAADLKATVQSYQKVASLGGWAGAGRALWAIAALGAVAGAAVGAVAPLFPLLVGVGSLSLEVIGASMASFASMGMAMGFGGGLMLGRISGSNAAVAEEQELRLKSWITSQLKQIAPEYQVAPSPDVSIGSIQGNALSHARDTYETYVNPKVGMAMAAIGGAGGLILSAGYLATGGSVGAIGPMLENVTGVANISSVPSALIAYTTGVTASFGALWTLNFPKITSNMTEFTGKLVGGKIIGRTWEPQRVLEKTPETTLPEPHIPMAPPEPAATDTPLFAERFSKPAVDYRQMIQAEKQHTPQDISIA